MKVDKEIDASDDQAILNEVESLNELSLNLVSSDILRTDNVDGDGKVLQKLEAENALELMSKGNYDDSLEILNTQNHTMLNEVLRDREMSMYSQNEQRQLPLQVYRLDLKRKRDKSVKSQVEKQRQGRSMLLVKRQFHGNQEYYHYKLASYANSLQAAIKPSNFKTLKDYFELVSKAPKIAQINKNHFVRNLIDQNGAKSFKDNKKQLCDQKGEEEIKVELLPLPYKFDYRTKEAIQNLNRDNRSKTQSGFSKFYKQEKSLSPAKTMAQTIQAGFGQAVQQMSKIIPSGEQSMFQISNHFDTSNDVSQKDFQLRELAARTDGFTQNLNNTKVETKSNPLIKNKANTVVSVHLEQFKHTLKNKNFVEFRKKLQTDQQIQSRLQMQNTLQKNATGVLNIFDSSNKPLQQVPDFQQQPAIQTYNIYGKKVHQVNLYGPNLQSRDNQSKSQNTVGAFDVQTQLQKPSNLELVELPLKALQTKVMVGHPGRQRTQQNLIESGSRKDPNSLYISHQGSRVLSVAEFQMQNLAQGSYIAKKPLYRQTRTMMNIPPSVEPYGNNYDEIMNSAKAMMEGKLHSASDLQQLLNRQERDELDNLSQNQKYIHGGVERIHSDDRKVEPGFLLIEGGNRQIVKKPANQPDESQASNLYSDVTPEVNRLGIYSQRPQSVKADQINKTTEYDIVRNSGVSVSDKQIEATFKSNDLTSSMSADQNMDGFQNEMRQVFQIYNVFRQEETNERKINIDLYKEQNSQEDQEEERVNDASQYLDCDLSQQNLRRSTIEMFESNSSLENQHKPPTESIFNNKNTLSYINKDKHQEEDKRNEVISEEKQVDQISTRRRLPDGDDYEFKSKYEYDFQQKSNSILRPIQNFKVMLENNLNIPTEIRNILSSNLSRNGTPESESFAKLLMFRDNQKDLSPEQKKLNDELLILALSKRELKPSEFHIALNPKQDLKKNPKRAATNYQYFRATQKRQQRQNKKQDTKPKQIAIQPNPHKIVVKASNFLHKTTTSNFKNVGSVFDQTLKDPRDFNFATQHFMYNNSCETQDSRQHDSNTYANNYTIRESDQAQRVLYSSQNSNKRTNYLQNTSTLYNNSREGFYQNRVNKGEGQKEKHQLQVAKNLKARNLDSDIDRRHLLKQPMDTLCIQSIQHAQSNAELATPLRPTLQGSGIALSRDQISPRSLIKEEQIIKQSQYGVRHQEIPIKNLVVPEVINQLTQKQKSSSTQLSKAHSKRRNPNLNEQSRRQGIQKKPLTGQTSESNREHNTVDENENSSPKYSKDFSSNQGGNILKPINRFGNIKTIAVQGEDDDDDEQDQKTLNDENLKVQLGNQKTENGRYASNELNLQINYNLNKSQLLTSECETKNESLRVNKKRRTSEQKLQNSTFNQREVDDEEIQDTDQEIPRSRDNLRESRWDFNPGSKNSSKRKHQTNQLNSSLDLQTSKRPFEFGTKDEKRNTRLNFSDESDLPTNSMKQGGENAAVTTVYMQNDKDAATLKQQSQLDESLFQTEQQHEESLHDDPEKTNEINSSKQQILIVQTRSRDSHTAKPDSPKDLSTANLSVAEKNEIGNMLQGAINYVNQDVVLLAIESKTDDKLSRPQTQQQRLASIELIANLKKDQMQYQKTHKALNKAKSPQRYVKSSMQKFSKKNRHQKAPNDNLPFASTNCVRGIKTGQVQELPKIIKQTNEFDKRNKLQVDLTRRYLNNGNSTNGNPLSQESLFQFKSQTFSGQRAQTSECIRQRNADIEEAQKDQPTQNLQSQIILQHIQTHNSLMLQEAQSSNQQSKLTIEQVATQIEDTPEFKKERAQQSKNLPKDPLQISGESQIKAKEDQKFQSQIYEPKKRQSQMELSNSQLQNPKLGTSVHLNLIKFNQTQRRIEYQRSLLENVIRSKSDDSQKIQRSQEGSLPENERSNNMPQLAAKKYSIQTNEIDGQIAPMSGRQPNLDSSTDEKEMQVTIHLGGKPNQKLTEDDPIESSERNIVQKYQSTLVYQRLDKVSSQTKQSQNRYMAKTAAGFYLQSGPQNKLNLQSKTQSPTSGYVSPRYDMKCSMHNHQNAKTFYKNKAAAQDSKAKSRSSTLSQNPTIVCNTSNKYRARKQFTLLSSTKLTNNLDINQYNHTSTLTHSKRKQESNNLGMQPKKAMEAAMSTFHKGSQRAVFPMHEQQSSVSSQQQMFATQSQRHSGNISIFDKNQIIQRSNLHESRKQQPIYHPQFDKQGGIFGYDNYLDSQQKRFNLTRPPNEQGLQGSFDVKNSQKTSIRLGIQLLSNGGKVAIGDYEDENSGQLQVRMSSEFDLNNELNQELLSVDTMFEARRKSDLEQLAVTITDESIHLPCNQITESSANVYNIAGGGEQSLEGQSFLQTPLINEPYMIKHPRYTVEDEYDKFQTTE